MSIDNDTEADSDTSPDRFVWVTLPHITNTPTRRRLIAAARKASIVSPGTSADLWPLYRERPTHADSDLALAVEHTVIGLWGTHQQGEKHNVHRSRVNFGASARQLFNSRYPDKRGPKATAGDDFVTRRLALISHARTWDIAAHQMASLIRNFHGRNITCDYTDLYWALLTWDNPQRHQTALTTWARAYHVISKAITDTDTQNNEQDT